MYRCAMQSLTTPDIKKHKSLIIHNENNFCFSILASNVVTAFLKLLRKSDFYILYRFSIICKTEALVINVI